KEVRDLIVGCFKKGNEISTIDGKWRTTDTAKNKNFQEVCKGLKKAFGNKTFDYEFPPKEIWKHNELEIRLNPELGIIINDKPHILKLYFKKEELTKDNIQALISLMETELKTLVPEKAEYGILDIRRGKILFKDKR